MNSKNYTSYEKSLCKSARLFSISKKNLDLFLLLQTNTITYSQLHISKLHGNTEASGRLSLKRLENNGLIQGKQLPGISQTKYYFLTPKGRNSLKKWLPSYFTKQLQINWERRPPSSSLQIQHRISVNDFYYAYISLPNSHPLPWILEQQLNPTSDIWEVPPRCDGLLKGTYANYYIEQDNNTQSQNALLKKMNQYIQAGLFSKNTSARIVFCLAFPRQMKSSQKPPFSIYKILLKFTKLWSALEEIHQLPLDYYQLLQALHNSQLEQTISSKDLISFENIHRIHPDMETLTDAISLKKYYSNQTAALDEYYKELDNCYHKRLKSHFSRFYHLVNDTPSLYLSALQGIPLFVVANHRLPIYQSYIMAEEKHFKNLLFQHLFYNGLITDNWRFFCPIKVSTQTSTYFFRLGIAHTTYGHIIVENLTIDISAQQRILYFYSSNRDNTPPIYILLLADIQDIAHFFQENKTLLSNTNAKNVHFLYSDPNGFTSSHSPIYLIKEGDIDAPILFECDAFDEQLHIISQDTERGLHYAT